MHSFVQRWRTLMGQRSEAWEAQDFQAWSQADRQFHLEVARASGVTQTYETYETYGSFSEVFHGAQKVQRLADGFGGFLCAGHEALTDAIEAGDSEAASRVVGENLDYCMSWIP